jgi:hypothetical protein
MCIHKLDEFLKASGRKLLDHAGTISAEVGKAKASLSTSVTRPCKTQSPERSMPPSRQRRSS